MIIAHAASVRKELAQWIARYTDNNRLRVRLPAAAAWSFDFCVAEPRRSVEDTDDPQMMGTGNCLRIVCGSSSDHLRIVRDMLGKCLQTEVWTPTGSGEFR